ncbi:labile enterotoxin output A [Helicobacter saguini]|uniref:Labile enterotoxin output A n=1 Tax=Helicobacter saguini TaxID=1548018 RepID=A0A347VPL7_9HELI|nr:LeoA/HP0731 family dynamin-like GTPase [Helicobacter saguini]MWV61305.1 labile enterotoxin output A [Helicobacter saguini]MWV68026.1 labile enterotoxin output A [Helicobacter saguini]MWV70507.1 labile enterotoxin output A [Helicobacter saguini]MWV72410.1 labile enterotoxin output A [Helicobacter saguini]TLD91860.1 labile enterotoxin output A [Helicobacter saguini]
MQSAALQEFENKKAKTKETLEKLLRFLQEGIDLNVDIESSYIDKIKEALNETQNVKLKVALIGGFSEGKTSIAAAWLEKLKDNMNINVAESSDEVAIYDINDDLEIIDTPGLFGFKEKYNDERKLEAYKDKTKKYISSANIVLYVLNPSNPIKESHKDDLVWLFRELNLLPRTIFVIGKFDEVVDIEDSYEYDEMYKTKKQNILQRLEQLIKLTQSEKDSINIVAVSANPFNKGIEYWLQNKEEYRKLSHIKALQDATKEKIEKSGGALAIIESTKDSIIKDVLNKELPKAEQNFEIIQTEITKLDKVAKNTSKDLKRLNSDIELAKRNLNDFILQYFDDLIISVNGLSLQTFKEFYDKEIGENGINVRTRVQNKFSEETESIYGEINQVAINLDTEVKRFESDIMKLGKQGVSFLQTSKVINSANILKVRDGIVSGGKMIGLNLGKYLKFKPWGAVNLAGRISAVLAIVSLALEIWDSYKRMEAEDKLKEAKMELENTLKEQKSEILSLVNSTDFKRTFFENALILETSLQDIESNLKLQQEKESKMLTWLQNGNALKY